MGNQEGINLVLPDVDDGFGVEVTVDVLSFPIVDAIRNAAVLVQDVDGVSKIQEQACRLLKSV